MNDQKQPWLNNWEIVRGLGEGGQGQTFLVRKILQPDQQGVLKTLKKNESMQARGRMRMEVTHLETLSFQKIKVPAVLDSNMEQYQDAGIPLYFVMDYIEGDTLKEAVRTKGPFQFETVAIRRFVSQHNFQAAHNNGSFITGPKASNIRGPQPSIRPTSKHCGLRTVLQ